MENEKKEKIEVNLCWLVSSCSGVEVLVAVFEWELSVCHDAMILVGYGFGSYPVCRLYCCTVVTSGVLVKFLCLSPLVISNNTVLFSKNLFFPKLMKLYHSNTMLGWSMLSSYNAVSVRSIEVMSTVALSIAVVGAFVNTFLHRHATAPRSSIDAVRLAARIVIPRTSLPPPVVGPVEFADFPGLALMAGVVVQLEPLSQTTWFDAGVEGLFVVPLEEWEELAGVAGEGAVVVNLGVEEEASGVLVNLIVIGVEDVAGVGAVGGGAVVEVGV